MSKLTATVVEIPTDLMVKHAGLRDLEAEFFELFDRPADDEDRALGLARTIDTMKSLQGTLLKIAALADAANRLPI